MPIGERYADAGETAWLDRVESRHHRSETSFANDNRFPVLSLYRYRLFVPHRFSFGPAAGMRTEHRSDQKKGINLYHQWAVRRRGRLSHCNIQESSPIISTAVDRKRLKSSHELP